MGLWKALLGRVTLFPIIPTGTEAVSALDLYRRVWGSDPDVFQKQPPSGTLLVPSVAQGTQNGLSVSCLVQPVRIDLSITPQAQAGFKLIEDTRLFHDALSGVVRTITNNNTIPTNRAACSAQFSCPAKDYHEANVFLSSSIPNQYKVALEDEEDFILQINRPRQIDDIKMNYITKWSADRLQVMSLQVVPPQGQAASALGQLVSEYILANVTFDNSSAPAALLPNDRLHSVLEATLQSMSEQQREANLDLEGF
jgi:hypothetical protein